MDCVSLLREACLELILDLDLCIAGIACQHMYIVSEWPFLNFEEYPSDFLPVWSPGCAFSMMIQ